MYSTVQREQAMYICAKYTMHKYSVPHTFYLSQIGSAKPTQQLCTTHADVRQCQTFYSVRNARLF